MNYKIVAILLGLIQLLIFSGCGGGSGGSSDAGNNSITLAWDAPTENTDGSPLNDLAGYKIYYGTSSQSYTASVDVGSVTMTTISNLESGLWCFTGTAYNSSGNESDFAAEICENI